MSNDVKNDAVKAITQAMKEMPYNAQDRSVDHAISDRELPAFVRATVLLMCMSATNTYLLRAANMLPPLYANHEGRACRVTLVSAMGDIGVSYTERDMGYDRRGLSLYDLTDFSQEKPLGFSNYKG